MLNRVMHLDREEIVRSDTAILQERLLRHDIDDALVSRRNFCKIENFTTNSGVDVVWTILLGVRL
jgi:hypothetical protein